MPIRTVAIDRDVRAQRRLPSVAQLSSVHGLSRAASILALIALDCCSIMIAVIVVPPITGLGWAMWPGLSWVNIGVACVVLVSVAAAKGLYGRRFSRHSARKVLSTWTIAFVVTTLLMLLVDPVGIGARYVVAWALGGTLALAGRFAFDRLAVLRFGSDGDAPPALLLGTRALCGDALAALASLAPADRVRVVGLVLPDGDDGEPGP